MYFGRLIRNQMVLRAFLFISLYLASFTLFSQQYKPILEGYKEWTLLNCNGSSCRVESYQLGADTILENTRYTLLDGYHFNGTVLVREDTLTQRFYMKAIGTSTLNPEVLTYDFSLNVGDSMRVTNTQSPVPTDGGFFHVDSIQHINYEGTIRKTLYLSGNDTSKKELNRAIWVEGIGSLSIINSPGLFPNHEYIAAVSCTHVDGKLIYRFNSGRGDSCVVYYTSRELYEEKGHNPQISVYPNPTYGELHIKISAADESEFQVELFDMFGKLQLEKNINTETTIIDISSLPAGQFILRTIDKNGGVSRKRIVILNSF